MPDKPTPQPYDPDSVLDSAPIGDTIARTHCSIDPSGLLTYTDDPIPSGKPDDPGGQRAQRAKQIDKFVASLRVRLNAGAREYGEQSFAVSADRLLVELQQEMLDIAGWGFVLWAKVEDIRTAVREALK